MSCTTIPEKTEKSSNAAIAAPLAIGSFSFQGCVDFRDTAWPSLPINRSVPEPQKDEKGGIKGELKDPANAATPVKFLLPLLP
jgi:hypothetical protein